MLGFVGRVVMDNKQAKEKLREWLDSIPEVAKQRGPANVLAFVFFVELMKEKEKEKEEVKNNA